MLSRNNNVPECSFLMRLWNDKRKSVRSAIPMLTNSSDRLTFTIDDAVRAETNF